MVVGVQWRLTARRAWRRMVEARLHGRLLVHRVELLLAELGHVRALVPGGLLLRHRRTCRRGGGGARSGPRRRCSEQNKDQGCRKTCTAPGGENKRTKLALANLAINAPRTPARAYPGEAEARDHEVGILGCASCWRPLGGAPLRHRLSPWTRRRHGAGSAHRSSGTGEITSPVTSNCSRSRNWCAIAPGRHRCRCAVHRARSG